MRIKRWTVWVEGFGNVNVVTGGEQGRDAAFRKAFRLLFGGRWNEAMVFNGRKIISVREVSV